MTDEHLADKEFTADRYLEEGGDEYILDYVLSFFAEREELEPNPYNDSLGG